MKAVHDALAAFPLAKNPYFVALREGTFDREDFIATQVQFYYAVVFFSRPMAVLAARIPSPELRIEVMRNVWEEHGEGDPSTFHANTFQEFLKRLGGIDLDSIESNVLWPEVRAFNTTLSGCAMLDDWEVATGCFGMVERMFVDASAWIAQALVAQGWMAKPDIVHYATHEKLDVKHSDDFFEVLVRGTDGSPRASHLIDQGLRLGAHVFYALYEGLYRARARRDKTTLRAVQPHIYRSR